MSDFSKRIAAWAGATLVTWLVLRDQTVSWWAWVGVCIGVGMLLHAFLNVSVVWIEGEDAWDRFETVFMGAAAAIGLLGPMLLIPDAPWIIKIVVPVVCVIAAAISLMICGAIRDWWRDRLGH